MNGKQIMVGPHCPWPLRCAATSLPCGTPEWRAAPLCTCQNCRAFRYAYPPREESHA